MIRRLRLLFLIGFLRWLAPAQAQNLRSVICTVPESWNGRQAMLVVSPLAGQRLIDTTTIHHQEAVFTVNVVEPCPAYVWIEDNKKDIPLFLDAPRIQITLDEKAQSQLFDSPSSARYEEVQQRLRAFSLGDLPEKVLEAIQGNDFRTASFYQQQIDSLHLAYANSLAALIQSDPTAPLSWYFFANNFDFLPYNHCAQLFRKLSSASSYPSYQRIAEQLSRRQLGTRVPDFNLPTPDGKVIQLSNVKGRLILVYFYDSHLVTSPMNHTRLAGLYETFHPRGLEIISVAFYPESKTWTSGMQREQLPWIQVDAPGDQAKSIRDAFAIDKPADYILIDAKGKLVARDLSVPEIQRWLEQNLPKK